MVAEQMASCWEHGFALVQLTPPTAEILSDKNVRAYLVCGFLMKSFKTYSEIMKKIVGAVWKLPAK